MAAQIVKAKLLGDANSTTARTGKGRLGYVHVDKPFAQNPNDEGKYSLCFMFSKDDKQAKKVLDAAIENAEQRGVEKFGKSFKNVHNPINDGDDKDDEIYENMYYINAKNSRHVPCYDQDREEMEPEDVYSGCEGRIVVQFYPYSRNGNNGVAASLQSIQFLGDAEPFAGRRASASDFEDDEDEDTSSMLD